MCSQNRIYDVDLEPDVLYQLERYKDDNEEWEEKNKLTQKELKCQIRQNNDLKRKYNILEQEFQAQRELAELKLKAKDEENEKSLCDIQQLKEELERMKQFLEESEKARLEILNKQVPVADESVIIRETNKQTRDYLYKLKMAEQDISVLQTANNRLKNQVARYKEWEKESETTQGELKADNRRILRELRESQAKNEELETNISHLQKRLDRLRSRNLMIGGDTSLTTITSSHIAPQSSQIPSTTATTTSTNTPSASYPSTQTNNDNDK